MTATLDRPATQDAPHRGLIEPATTPPASKPRQSYGCSGARNTTFLFLGLVAGFPKVRRAL